MKERPILFSAPMVRAILDGSKTQTRRVVKYHPLLGEPIGWCAAAKAGEPGFSRIVGDFRRFCPYGEPGDRLWVREEHYRFGHWEPVEGKKTKGGRQKWAFVADSDEVLFEPPGDYRKGRHHKDPATPECHKRLARFMPRAYSRITLEIVSVRVERLHDISEDDAMAEGVTPLVGIADEQVVPGPGFSGVRLGDQPHRLPFAFLWESINGDDSWDANPWVWVGEFRRVEEVSRD